MFRSKKKWLRFSGHAEKFMLESSEEQNLKIKVMFRALETRLISLDFILYRSVVFNLTIH